jgi:hypothetical protein
MTKKEAAVVIGFISMLPVQRQVGMWNTICWRQMTDTQFLTYVELVNSMVEDVQEDPH